MEETEKTLKNMGELIQVYKYNSTDEKNDILDTKLLDHLSGDS